jgi:hypothetical protein
MSTNPLILNVILRHARNIWFYLALWMCDIFLIIFRLCYVGHVYLAAAYLWHQLRLLRIPGSSDPYFVSVSALDTDNSENYAKLCMYMKRNAQRNKATRMLEV